MSDGFRANFRGMDNVKRLMDQGVIPNPGDPIEIEVKEMPLTFNCAICNVRIKDDGNYLCVACKTKVDQEVTQVREAEEEEKLQVMVKEELKKSKNKRVPIPIPVDTDVPKPEPVYERLVPVSSNEAEARYQVMRDIQREKELAEVVMESIFCERCNCGFHRLLHNPALNMLTVNCAECSDQILQVSLG
jgi:hypothetical protein